MSKPHPVRPSDVAYHFVFSLVRLIEVPDFVRKHRLWRGLNEYSWVIKFLIIAALLLGLSFLSVIIDWWRSLNPEPEAYALISSVGNLFTRVFGEGYELFTAGFMKYVLLILLEVVVYHFMRRTLTVLVNKESGVSFNDFLEAQKRMIKVVFRSYVYETIATILIGIVFWIFGFVSFLEPVLVFFVQCYFLGFAIVDNYMEQFGMTIRESIDYSYQYMGVSLALGLALYLILLFPLVGTIAGPILVSVGAGLIMTQLSDLHIIGREAALGIPVEPEPAPAAEDLDEEEEIL
jgi:hypothetical protein